MNGRVPPLLLSSPCPLSSLSSWESASKATRREESLEEGAGEFGDSGFGTEKNLEHSANCDISESELHIYRLAVYLLNAESRL